MAKKLIGSAALTPSSDTGFDLTTKGDTHGYSDTNARIPISTNNFSLLCDSAESLGLKWGASPTSVLSGTGDILYASGANTLARLAAGTQYFNLQQGASVPSWVASPTSVLDATGKMLYASSANTLAAISPGAENTVLTMGGSSVPGWAAAGGGGGGNYEFIEQFTLGSDASTFDCSLSSALAVGDFVSLVAIWRGKWNSTGNNALGLQVATNSDDPITAAQYSWAANVLTTTTSSSVFTNAVNIDNYTIGPSIAQVAGSKGSIKMELAIYPGEGADGETPGDIMVNWWQKGTSVCNSWGSGYVYNPSVAITTINGFLFTNAGGANIEAGTTVDFYKITS